MRKYTLYYGGTILTMEEDLYAEALLVEDGRIVAVGKLEDVKGQILHPDSSSPSDDSLTEPLTEFVDLKGCALMPSFIDAHSHFSGYAFSLLQIPLEHAESVSEVQTAIKDYIVRNQPQPGTWLTAKGYDHNRLQEQRHLTLQELDQASPEHPLVLQHQSGHLGVFNSLALDKFGVTPQTPAPEGGRIQVQNGKLTGYMEESAFLYYNSMVPGPEPEKLLAAVQDAAKCYASYGITTVQDGMIMDSMLPLYSAVVKNKLLSLDLVGYAGVGLSQQFMASFSDCIRQYRNHFKIGGYKIFLDGSPQGRTAWLREAYLPEAGSNPDYRGYNTLSDKAVEDAVQLSIDSGLQLLAHCNGDAACEQYLQAWEQAVQTPEDSPADLSSLRPVIVHAQLIGLDQLPRVKRLGLLPSFFTAHTYHWGDTHIRNFGPERASRISPAASALKEGIRFTFHQDSPVIQPDMMETIWCAVNRRTRKGVLLGPEEQISTLEALKAVTIHSAYQYFEEKEKGSLAPGKRADLVILDSNPLTTAPESLRQIKVLTTIKDGTVIYRNTKDKAK